MASIREQNIQLDFGVRGIFVPLERSFWSYWIVSNIINVICNDFVYKCFFSWSWNEYNVTREIWKGLIRATQTRTRHKYIYDDAWAKKATGSAQSNKVQ